MSVYKPRKSSFYAYDFVMRGQRYTGSTGQRLLRAAEKVENKIREDAKLGRLNDASQYTLDQAVGRWWLEIGQFRKDGAKPAPERLSKLEQRLASLIAIVGGETRLADIDQARVALAIERRRGRSFKRAKGKGAKEYLPANATVNRDIVETLRPILGRATTHWGAGGLPVINWRVLHLEEPRETVRVYGAAEEMRWLDEAKRTGWWKGKTPRRGAADVSFALELVLTYGLRLAELYFPLDAFDPDGDRAGPRLIWMKGRKLDVPHEVPLSEEHGREIAARLGRAVAAKLKSIWFYEEANGALVEITPSGMQERLNNAADRAGVSPGRRIHGGRHHAGSAFYADTKDLKLTQAFLGHLDPASTLRYVHADKSGVRAALENKKSRNSPGVAKAQGGKS